MKTIPISDIIVGDRQRKSFNENSLAELKKSIRFNGLLHPIILYEKAKVFHLVAGGRRIRAVAELPEATAIHHDGEPVPFGHIPYILANALPNRRQDINIREAELAENFAREDLTWQERLDALDEIHKLRLALNPNQTDSDTAREIAGGDPSLPAAEDTKIANTRRELARAKLIHPWMDDPEVRAAPNAQQAFNIVARKIEAEMQADLAKLAPERKSPHTLILGDLTDEMRKLPDDTYTCIIADPPYGIGADKFGDVADFTHQYDDGFGIAVAVAGAISTLSQSITKSEAHLWMFCDIDLFIAIRDRIDSNTEWNCWRTPIIWDKGTGYAPQQSSGFQRCYELILFASKGGKPFGAVKKDILLAPPVHDRVHAAQKPTILYNELLRRSCLFGDKVLDPCCGSGTIFTSAHETQMIATGIELSKEYHAHASAALANTLE